MGDGVAARTFDEYLESVGRDGDGSRSQFKRTGRDRRVDMECHQPVDPLDQPIAHDLDCPSREYFLGRLEYEPDASAVQTYPSQDDGCVRPAGGMRVIPACVHQLIRGAAEGERRQLEDGQGVDVGAKSDGWFAGPDVGGEAGPGQARRVATP